MPQLILNYHRIASPGETVTGKHSDFVLDRKQFVRQMELIAALEIPVVPLDYASKERETVASLTFDDGHHSDIDIVASTLFDHGFSATFFPVTGLIDKKGYLRKTEILELAREGFQIGSHGKSHKHLSRLSLVDLQSELLESKDLLEQLTGTAIEQLALPYGAYNSLFIHEAELAGYRQILSTKFGFVRPDQQPLPRWNIKRSLSIRDFENILSGKTPAVLARRLNSWGSRRFSQLADAIHASDI